MCLGFGLCDFYVQVNLFSFNDGPIIPRRLTFFLCQGRLSKRQKTRRRTNASKRGRKLGLSPPTPLVKSVVRLYFFGGCALCAWSILQVCVFLAISLVSSDHVLSGAKLVRALSAGLAASRMPGLANATQLQEPAVSNITTTPTTRIHPHRC